MEILEVDAIAYDGHLKAYHAFGKGAFAALNAPKVPSVHYLLFRDSRVRLGIIGATVDGVFRSPFSAPFDGFTPSDEDVSLQSLEAAAELLEGWAAARGITKLHITLPPPIYGESFLAKVVNVFFRRSYRVIHTELNFHFNLDRLTDAYPSTIWRNARKNLRQAMDHGLLFRICSTPADEEAAYDIIRLNRQARSKPLRMTLDQIRQTAVVMPISYFLVTTREQMPVGAAIVFQVAPRIGQVVYWGDLPAHAGLRTMNFLSYKLFEYYRTTGLEVLDIGYSTENSLPNYGLCEFKESLGCSLQPKLIYEKSL